MNLMLSLCTFSSCNKSRRRIIYIYDSLGARGYPSVLTFVCITFATSHSRVAIQSCCSAALVAIP